MFKNMVARFVSGNLSLSISAKGGKKAGQVRVTQKLPGMKNVTGCRSAFEMNDAGFAKAKSVFDGLVADAVKKGWTRKAARSNADAFSEIPAIPVAAPAADAPKADAPVANGAAAPKGKK